MSKVNFKQYKLLNFDSTYASKGYPEDIWPILNEYFSRYQHEFNLTDDQISKKLSVVSNNLNKVIFGGTKQDSFLGRYSVRKRQIEINIKKIGRDTAALEKMLDTVFHELNHAGENLNSISDTSFTKYNNHTSSYEGVALNEIITEMKSSKLSDNKRVDKSNDTLNLNGYGDLIFAGSMLHSALGISENEFLKQADKGRYGFGQEMKKLFPSEEDYDAFMDTMIFYTDALHTLKYNSQKNGKYSPEDLDNITDYTNSMYINCLFAMDKIIPLKAFLNREPEQLKEYMQQCRFYLDKLNSNYERGFLYGNRDPKKNLKNAHPSATYDNQVLKDLQCKILTIETLAENRYRLLSNEYVEELSRLTEQSFNGQERLNAVCDKCGIQITKPVSELFDDKRTEQLTQEKQVELWNNQACIKDLKNFSKRESFIYKMLNKLKKQATKPKALTEPAQQSSRIPVSSLTNELSSLVSDTNELENIIQDSNNEPIKQKNDDTLEI